MDLQDRSYLTKRQYRDGSKLRARQRLHQTSSEGGGRWQRFVFEQIDLPRGARILEVGCGPAWLWAENSDRIPASWSLTLTDLSPGMIEEAISATARLACSVTTLVADCIRLPFAHAAFDAAVANHMLYHIQERPFAVAELARVTAPGALLLAATNGPEHLRELRELHEVYGGGEATPPVSALFDLENGPDQLLPWFPEAVVRRHPTRLFVRDPELVIEYLRSLPEPALSAKGEAEIRHRVQAAIESSGFWEVTSEAGVIVARRSGWEVR
ncbi:MAG TPA: methyltransferase domain-containing protein [Candidatus Dormibacteraeota bacterium]|nr:methyltransferase domain-containing protein [Candidatus Dormibacteraeota bacterium]